MVLDCAHGIRNPWSICCYGVGLPLLGAVASVARPRPLLTAFTQHSSAVCVASTFAEVYCGLEKQP